VSDIEKLVAILKKGRHSFYHFTDTRNLPQIREHGLRAMKAIKAEGRAPVAAGGNDWSLDADRRSGMDRYVHLCFFSEHPMEWLAKNDGRIETSIFLRISPSVLLSPGVLITDGVSNKSSVTPKPAEEMIAKLDLHVIYTRTDWKDPAIQERLKAARLCELLVPDHVPVKMIANLPNG
jgi:hypothetical protein